MWFDSFNIALACQMLLQILASIYYEVGQIRFLRGISRQLRLEVKVQQDSYTFGTFQQELVVRVYDPPKNENNDQQKVEGKGAQNAATGIAIEATPWAQIVQANNYRPLKHALQHSRMQSA
mmetsp:Transcript_4303/g.5745  ORF Transcript_4303/g.5745 Transcript_4303/m.5745 type:complete len:121 (-) Transcript_4303:525-887(-)